MKHIPDSQKKLVDHISRLEGQLASVKAEILKGDMDCSKASKTLYASARSFASLRQSFIKCFLEKHYIPKGVRTKRSGEYADLLKVINS